MSTGRLPERGLRLVVPDPIRAVDPLTCPLIGTEKADDTSRQGPGPPDVFSDMVPEFIGID